MKISIVMGYFLPVPALQGGSTEKIWHRLAALMAEAGNDVTIVSRQWPGLAAHESIGRLHHARLKGMDHTRRLSLNLVLDLIWGLRVARNLPAADVTVCNTVSLPVYLRHVRPRAGRVAVVLGRMPKGQNRFYGAVDTVLATSTAVADRVRLENPSLSDRIFQFPNPIDWELHRACSRQEQPGRILHIGYVGRIHPEKGLEQLLEAACRLASRTDLPEWRVSLVGPVAVTQGGGGDAYRERLVRTYAPKLGGRLAIEPPVFNPADLARRYGDFDIFCYPSLAALGEGLSIAPIEAMAAGAVPVLSQLDCYRDLIVPDVNGCQFNHAAPNPAGGLAEILLSLLSNPAQRRVLAIAAQQTARRFDYAVTARVLLDHFARLTGKTAAETVRSS